MAEIASAYVTIYPKFASGFDKGLKNELGSVGGPAGAQAGKGFQSGFNRTADGSVMGKKLGSGISSGFKSAVGLMGAALAAVGIGAFVSEAMAASDATDKFKQTLKFAGLDTGTIDKLATSTRAYADATVYELSDIQNITAQLAANGVKNYDQLAEAVGNLNAAAGGNAETFGRIGMMLTQTAGAGKLTTENWNQLADAIPGASMMLQDAMRKNGAYTGNFREAMEKGEITAEEFNQALMDLGLTDVAREAATATTTFEGAFGNLKATAVGALSDIITEFKPLGTDMINSATDGIKVLSDQFKGFMDWLALNPEVVEGVSAAFKILGDMLGGVARIIAAVAFPALSVLIRVFAGLLDGIQGTLEALGKIPGFEWAADGARDLDKVVAAAARSADGIDRIGRSLNGTSTAADLGIAEIESRLGDLRTTINNSGGTININGNTVTAEQAARLLIDNINQDTGTVTINGNSVPAEDALDTLISTINNDPGGVVVIDGNNEPAKTKADEVVSYAANLTGATVPIGADTGPAQSGVNGFLGWLASRPMMNIPVGITILSAAGGLIPGLAPGGRVPGWSPHDRADNIPAMLTAGEFVQPVATVEHYGIAAMEAVRRRRAVISYGDGGSVAGGGPSGSSAMDEAAFVRALQAALSGLQVKLTGARVLTDMVTGELLLASNRRSGVR